MKRTVAVVDYGMGNLRSVSQAVQHVARGTALNVIVTSRPDEVMAAQRVVLPGHRFLSARTVFRRAEPRIQ